MPVSLLVAILCHSILIHNLIFHCSIYLLYLSQDCCVLKQWLSCYTISCCNAITEFRKSLFPDCIRKWNELPVDLWKIVKLDDFMNEITIPLKSNNLYYGIKRKLGVIHSQFRMQCSNLKDDLHSLHVVDDPVCICSAQIENCEHFFFHCYLYATQRVAFLARLREITE